MAACIEELGAYIKEQGPAELSRQLNVAVCALAQLGLSFQAPLVIQLARAASADAAAVGGGGGPCAAGAAAALAAEQAAREPSSELARGEMLAAPLSLTPPAAAQYASPPVQAIRPPPATAASASPSSASWSAAVEPTVRRPLFLEEPIPDSELDGLDEIDFEQTVVFHSGEECDPNGAGNPTTSAQLRAAGVGGCEADLQTLALPLHFRPFCNALEEEVHFPLTPGTLIAGRYLIEGALGSGVFSRAVQCYDRESGERVCIKVIRNNKDFFDQSLGEIKLLRYLNALDPHDSEHILRMRDFFYFREHLFIVCELLRDNLYELYKYFKAHVHDGAHALATMTSPLAGGRLGEAAVAPPGGVGGVSAGVGGLPRYFTVPRVLSVARQVLTALAFVHSHCLVHCDLKPENILVQSQSKCIVKVIDFGSSSFVRDPHSSYVQSRSYRAPEVVLGLPYSAKIDVWSLGCILCELLLGEVLFPNRDVRTLLAVQQAICGPLPAAMLAAARHGPLLLHRGRLFARPTDGGGGGWRYLRSQRTSLGALLAEEADPELVAFLDALLTPDPDKRPTAAEALRARVLQRADVLALAPYYHAQPQPEEAALAPPPPAPTPTPTPTPLPTTPTTHAPPPPPLPPSAHALPPRTPPAAPAAPPATPSSSSFGGALGVALGGAAAGLAAALRQHVAGPSPRAAAVQAEGERARERARAQASESGGGGWGAAALAVSSIERANPTTNSTLATTSTTAAPTPSPAAMLKAPSPTSGGGGGGAQREQSTAAAAPAREPPRARAKPPLLVLPAGSAGLGGDSDDEDEAADRAAIGSDGDASRVAAAAAAAAAATAAAAAAAAASSASVGRCATLSPPGAGPVTSESFRQVLALSPEAAARRNESLTSEGLPSEALTHTPAASAGGGGLALAPPGGGGDALGGQRLWKRRAAGAPPGSPARALTLQPSPSSPASSGRSFGSGSAHSISAGDGGLHRPAGVRSACSSLSSSTGSLAGPKATTAPPTTPTAHGAPRPAARTARASLDAQVPARHARKAEPM